LWPGRKPDTLHSGVTNDRFAIQLDDDARASDAARSAAWAARALPGNLIVVGLAVMAVTAALLRWGISTFNIDVMADMAHTVGYRSLTTNPQFEDGKTMQQPPENTISRAGVGMQQILNPFSAADTAAVQRGEQVFRNFCVPCHGVSGNGDGIVAQ